MPFTDAKVLMHVAKCRLTTEEREKDERVPVFAVGLVREPLTYRQAKQLGPEILGHCFTERKAIRDGLNEVTVDLDLDEQRVIAYMAEDDAVGEHCQLRQVRITSVKITTRDGSEGSAATKSKKVAPQQPVLRATFACLIDPAEKGHRDFLALNFAKSFYFTFEDEQANLFTGVPTKDDAADDQPDLPIAPLPDADAGDVLDEAPARARRRGRPKKSSPARGRAKTSSRARR